MIQLATVGTSSICDSFLEGSRLTQKFTLSAVYSRSIDVGTQFAKKHGCNRVFCDLTQMAKSPFVDAVYIASPNVFHASQSRIFLEHKKHVICEKPITTSAAEYNILKQLADKNGVIYMEAIIPRHIKEYSHIKAAVAKIGKIKSANITYCQRSSRLDAFLAGQDVNIFNMSLHAGTLMDLGVYCVYGAVDLLGVPNCVKAKRELLYNGADGSGTATFDYGDFTANLSYSKTQDSLNPSVIVGQKGILQIDMISQYAGVTLINGNTKTNICGHLTKPQQMSGEANRFADYILNFSANKQDYTAASELCFNVHKCMDLIKTAADLKYPG